MFRPPSRFGAAARRANQIDLVLTAVFVTFYLVLREPAFALTRFGSAGRLACCDEAEECREVEFFDRWGMRAPGDSVREGL
jgi:hypothetical protein